MGAVISKSILVVCSHSIGFLRSIVISVLALFLVVEVVVGVIMYFKNRRITPFGSPVEMLGGLPLELSAEFDPTQNAPRFMIESVDKQAKSFDMKSVWPPSFEGKRLTSRITCREIKIVGPGESEGENVNLDKLLERMEGVSKEMMIFSGLCGDNTCREINRACRLYMAKVAP